MKLKKRVKNLRQWSSLEQTELMQGQDKVDLIEPIRDTKLA